MTRIDLKKEYNFLSNGLHCNAQVNKSDIAIKIPKINNKILKNKAIYFISTRLFFCHDDSSDPKINGLSSP